MSSNEAALSSQMSSHILSIEAITALRAAGTALGDVDVSGWDDPTLTDNIDELSEALVELDTQLSRIAEAIRARGFRIAEPAPATPPTITATHAHLRAVA
jgi:hypothetical protein